MSWSCDCHMLVDSYFHSRTILYLISYHHHHRPYSIISQIHTHLISGLVWVSLLVFLSGNNWTSFHTVSHKKQSWWFTANTKPAQRIPFLRVMAPCHTKTESWAPSILNTFCCFKFVCNAVTSTIWKALWSEFYKCAWCSCHNKSFLMLLPFRANDQLPWPSWHL